MSKPAPPPPYILVLVVGEHVPREINYSNSSLMINHSLFMILSSVVLVYYTLVVEHVPKGNQLFKFPA